MKSIPGERERPEKYDNRNYVPEIYYYTQFVDSTHDPSNDSTTRYLTVYCLVIEQPFIGDSTYDAS